MSRHLGFHPPLGFALNPHFLASPPTTGIQARLEVDTDFVTKPLSSRDLKVICTVQSVHTPKGTRPPGQHREKPGNVNPYRRGLVRVSGEWQLTPRSSPYPTCETSAVVLSAEHVLGRLQGDHRGSPGIPQIGTNMATLNRVRVALTGFPGAPGVMTLHTNNALTFLGPLRSFLSDMTVYLPTNFLLTIQGDGDVFESSTGTISGTWTAAAGDPVVGTAGGGYQGASGIMAEWRTDAFLSGRRLKGKTFFVPATNSIFTVDGTLENLVLADIRAKAATFVAATAGNFVVWQRPRPARAASGTLPALPARIGGYGTVSSSRVPDKSIVLRSRRD